MKHLLKKCGYEIHAVYSAKKGTIDESTFARICSDNRSRLQEHRIENIHYGCGPKLFAGNWVNVDLNDKHDSASGFFMEVNLVEKHPFPSGFFAYAFSEDFIEHLDQSDALIFLSEAYRTLRPNGVLRLSFPGMREVLKRHYLSSDYEGATVGKYEAYTMWGHRHFFCEESLSLAAKHIGYSEVNFVEYGISEHHALSDLDSRADQKRLNIHAELRK